MTLKLESEKEKEYKILMRFCKRNGIKEAKFLTFDNVLISYKAVSKK